MKVALPRLTEDDNKKRARLLQEQSDAAGHTPAVARAGGEVPRAPGPASTHDIAARALARLDREA